MSRRDVDEVAAPAPSENEMKKSSSAAINPDLQRDVCVSPLTGASASNETPRRGDDREELSEDGNTEVDPPPPVENSHERRSFYHEDLEQVRSDGREARRSHGERHPPPPLISSTRKSIPQYRIHFYIASYLVFFSILGTLARLGLQALTVYPGAPVTTTLLWANFTGCLVMGFLAEDRFLFRREWASVRRQAGEQNGSSSDESIMATAKERHLAMKKTVPLYIGLAVGFCGSITSFSSFIRDAFLGLSNELPTYSFAGGAKAAELYPRNKGNSVMALLAIIIIEVSVCTSALTLGAHLSIALEPYVASMRTLNLRPFIDPIIAFLAWAVWLGAIVLAIWPPDRPGGPSERGPSWSHETWRGQVLFALVFAPLGCYARFQASARLNGRFPRFPLGTFVVNICGTAILGLTWDLQRAPWMAGAAGGARLGCQLLQGVEDGFCGCLTTVSTWVLELKTLRSRHAYLYGLASLLLALLLLIVEMGAFIWTDRLSPLQCAT